MRRDPSEAPPAQRKKPSLAARRELLLYVEDDDDNWEVAEYRLSEAYDVIRAATAEEACQLVRTRRNEIDLILMDIELRGSDLNGVELTELLRGNSLPASRSIPAYARNLPPVSKPVIYVTAHGKRYTNVQLMLSGADKVIAKPVNFADLRIAVSELIQDRTSG
jgi:CheY-like chemotaxis protein